MSAFKLGCDIFPGIFCQKFKSLYRLSLFAGRCCEISLMSGTGQRSADCIRIRSGCFCLTALVCLIRGSSCGSIIVFRCRGSTGVVTLYIRSGKPCLRKVFHCGRGLNLSGLIEHIPVLALHHKAGGQSAPFFKIVILAVHFDPSGSHCTVSTKIVALAVYGFPAGYTITVFVKIISLVVNGEPGSVVGAVILDITPLFILLIPLRRTIRTPECITGQSAAIDRDTSPAGRCFEVIAIVLSRFVGAVRIIFNRAQIIFYTPVICLQLVLQICQLSVNRLIIITV